MPQGKKPDNIWEESKDKAKQVTPSVGQHPVYDAMLLGPLTEEYYRRLAEQSQQQTSMHHTP